MQTNLVAAILVSMLAVTLSQALDASLLSNLLKDLERDTKAYSSPSSVDHLLRSIQTGGETMNLNMEETLGRILDAQVVAAAKRNMATRQDSGYVCSDDSCENGAVCSTTDKPDDADFMCYCKNGSGYSGLRCEILDACYKDHKFPLHGHDGPCSVTAPSATYHMCIPSSIKYEGYYCI